MTSVRYNRSFKQCVPVVSPGEQSYRGSCETSVVCFIALLLHAGACGDHVAHGGHMVGSLQAYGT